MSVGEELRKARLARGLTPSQVALATKMKVQTVEALENEDFDRIAAPIYAKGFIRLYAQCVGLDPAPLIEEYTKRFAVRPAAVSPLRSSRKASRVLSGKAEVVGSSVEASARDLFGSLTEAESGTAVDGQASLPQAAFRPSVWIRLRKACRDWSSAAIGLQLAEFFRQSKDFIRQRFGRRGSDLAKEASRGPEFLTIIPKVLPVAVGIFILLVLLVSVLSRCVRSSASSEHRKPSTQEEVTVALEVPQPYFE